MNTIILGSNHNNTLGLVWSLGTVGHNVTLLLYKGENNYVSYSKYIQKIHFINKGDNVVALIKHVSSLMDDKPVVFVTNDKDATLLNNNYTELKDCCYFEGGQQNGSVNRYRDKDEEERLAKECGFSIPQTVVIRCPEELASVTLPYPLFIKANNSVHGGKSAMKKCDTKQEAEAFVNGLPQEYFPLLVQEFIEKEYELMLLGCSLYGGKKTICPVANKKIRQYPLNTGAGAFSCSVEVAANENLGQLATKVAQYLQTIEYTGNFSAEFLFSNGKYYFLEINLRNDGTSWLSTCSGYNLPDMVARSYVYKGVSADNCTFSQRYYMNIIGEMDCWIHGIIKFKQLYKELNNDTCYSHYNKEDKEPWKKYIKHPLTWCLKIIVKKIANTFF